MYKGFGALHDTSVHPCVTHLLLRWQVTWFTLAYRGEVNIFMLGSMDKVVLRDLYLWERESLQNHLLSLSMGSGSHLHILVGEGISLLPSGV